MTPRQLHERLLAYEVDRKNEPDARRVMGCERQSLYLALESGDVQRISVVATEAERVARMWGVL